MVCYKFEYIHLQLEQVTVVKKNHFIALNTGPMSGK